MNKNAQRKKTVYGLTNIGAVSDITRSDENAKLRAIIGERFIAARQINGYQQQEAAEKIGYGNGTQLSLVENGTRLPPLPILIRAVETFGVSMDYLVGISDEPERDPRLAEKQSAMRHVSGMFSGLSEILVTQLQHYLTKGAPSVLATRALLKAGQGLVDAVQTLRNRNNDAFDELVGGATVLKRHDEFSKELIAAAAMLERHDRISEDVIKRIEHRQGITRPLFDQPETML
jgi:transcriptional regulator with XRE-family HTH domain